MADTLTTIVDRQLAASRTLAGADPPDTEVVAPYRDPDLNNRVPHSLLYLAHAAAIGVVAFPTEVYDMPDADETRAIRTLTATLQAAHVDPPDTEPVAPFRDASLNNRVPRSRLNAAHLATYGVAEFEPGDQVTWAYTTPGGTTGTYTYDYQEGHTVGEMFTLVVAAVNAEADGTVTLTLDGSGVPTFADVTPGAGSQIALEGTFVDNTPGVSTWTIGAFSQSTAGANAVANVHTGDEALLVSASPATAASAINDLDNIDQPLDPGDTITFTLTLPDGTPVEVVYTYAAGDTLAAPLAVLNGASGLNGTATAAINGSGLIVVTDAVAGVSQIAVAAVFADKVFSDNAFTIPGYTQATAGAAAVEAAGILTASENAQAGDTVVIGATTYTARASVSDPFDFRLAASASDTLDNLIAAIVAGAGEGTAYGTGTTAHPDVTAAAGAGDTVDVTALVAGTAGNSIATTDTGGRLTFGAVTLEGGAAAVPQVTDQDSAFTTPTATPAISGDLLSDLEQFTAGSDGIYSGLDTIDLVAVDHDGTAIAETFAVLTGSTLGDLIAFFNTSIPGATTTLEAGVPTVTSDTPGVSQLAITSLTFVPYADSATVWDLGEWADTVTGAAAIAEALQPAAAFEVGAAPATLASPLQDLDNVTGDLDGPSS